MKSVYNMLDISKILIFFLFYFDFFSKIFVIRKRILLVFCCVYFLSVDVNDNILGIHHRGFFFDSLMVDFLSLFVISYMHFCIKTRLF